MRTASTNQQHAPSISLIAGVSRGFQDRGDPTPMGERAVKNMDVLRNSADARQLAEGPRPHSGKVAAASSTQAPVSGIVVGTPITLPGVPQAMPGKWASTEIVRATALGGKVVFTGTKAQVERMMRTFLLIYNKSPTFRAQMDANIKAHGPMNFVAGKLDQTQGNFIAGAKAPFKNAIIIDESMFGISEKRFIETMVHECGHILTGYDDPVAIDPKTGKFIICGAIGGNERWIAQIMYEIGLNPKRVIKPYCDPNESGPNHKYLPPVFDKVISGPDYK